MTTTATCPRWWCAPSPCRGPPRPAAAPARARHHAARRDADLPGAAAGPTVPAGDVAFTGTRHRQHRRHRGAVRHQAGVRRPVATSLTSTSSNAFGTTFRPARRHRRDRGHRAAGDAVEPRGHRHRLVVHLGRRAGRVSSRRTWRHVTPPATSTTPGPRSPSTSPTSRRRTPRSPLPGGERQHHDVPVTISGSSTDNIGAAAVRLAIQTADPGVLERHRWSATRPPSTPCWAPPAAPRRPGATASPRRERHLHGDGHGAARRHRQRRRHAGHRELHRHAWRSRPPRPR